MVLEEIWIYPIKSLAGISLKEAKLEVKGFQHDRRWMIVDEKGMFITQRTYHELAFLQVQFLEDYLKVFDKRSLGNFIDIPLGYAKGEYMEVTVWDDQVRAQIVDPEICKWFSEFLGFNCHLVIMPESSERKIPAKYAVKDEVVSFADGMPYLIAGLSSLADLNQKLTEEVPMNRFRPNLVFSGGEAFAEDNWNTIQIGQAIFKVTKPCARCVFVNVNQETAKVSKEPLRTLSTYRNQNGKVMFGQNMIVLSGTKVKVGDVIKMLLNKVDN
jgi:uncharacterized protein